ncbi:MAG: hypothetical protein ACPLYD_16640, partial [Anaerolineae bacterium]
RYTDPSGYLTEEQIKSYFGVETWEEVLALFEKGGTLEGRWGWLETLRWARLGDEILFFGNYDGLWPSADALLFQGTLVDREGQLYIRSKDAYIPASKAAWLGDAYGVARLYSNEHMVYLGTLYAQQKYYHLKFNPGMVDWVGAGLDLGGIIADTVSLGTAGKLTDIAKIARTTGKVVDLSAIAWSWPPFSIGVIKGAPAGNEALELGVDVMDLLSPVPFVFDIVGLAVNINKGIYWMP